MITLKGLTQEQKDLCDILWSMDTMEEIIDWIDTQPLRRAKQAHVLLKLMAIEMIDESSTEAFPDAVKVINRIMSL